MNYTIERYQNFPIFILTNKGKPSVEDSLLQHEELGFILDNEPQRIYLLIDNTQLDFTFADLMQFFKIAIQGGKGSPSDKRIKQAIFISQSHLMSIMRDFIYKLTNTVVPVFASKEEGIEYFLKRVELDHIESTANNG